MEKKLRILAVDDSSINLAMIEQELKNTYEVITVNSGMRALRYLKQEKPDLILLDIQMASMDGIETLKDIRELKNGESIPVIMLTSQRDTNSLIESSKLGIYDYVLKPFQSQDLLDRISRTLTKAGVIPVENDELYKNIWEVQKELRTKNTKSAFSKLNLILNYNMDEEISGRLQAAKSKLIAGDAENARRMLRRILKILQQNGESGKFPRTPVSLSQLNTELLNVLGALENFNIRDAASVLEALLKYDIPLKIEELCEDAQEYLNEFDDGAAEELIREALRELKNVSS